MKRITSLIPKHRSPVTSNTKIAAHGSTTISIPGICWRDKKNGRLSRPPKSGAYTKKHLYIRLHKDI